MAHEIYTLNGKASMAYLARTARWHGLGNELKEGATLEAWLAAAGMEFDILSGEIIYKLQPPTLEGHYRRLGTFDTKKVLYRSDTGDALSIVSDRYKVVQPREIMEFFREMAEANQLKLKTAGVLRGGNRYWALAETEMVTDVKRGHRHRCYVLLSTSADASLATTAHHTDVCVVCNNTLTIATQDDRGAYKNRHDRAFDASAAKTHLGLDTFAADWEAFGATLRDLNRVKVTDEMAKDWFAQLLKTPAERQAQVAEDKKAESFADLLAGPALLAGNVAEKAKDVTPESVLKKVALLQEAYQNAPGAAPGTAYGLLQASTYYVDHMGRARSQANQLNNAWFGDGEALKNRALADAKALLQ